MKKVTHYMITGYLIEDGFQKKYLEVWELGQALGLVATNQP